VTLPGTANTSKANAFLLVQKEQRNEELVLLSREAREGTRIEQLQSRRKIGTAECETMLRKWSIMQGIILTWGKYRRQRFV